MRKRTVTKRTETKNDNGDSFATRLAMLFCTAIVGLVILVGLAYGIWKLTVTNVSPGGLAAWALLATALLPVSAWAGNRWGSNEARGLIAGIGLGAGPVVDTAQKVADVKVATAQRMRQPAPVVEVPEIVDVTPRLLGGGDGKEIVL